MKHIHLSILALAAIFPGLSSVSAADTVVGSGHVISETRAVSGFHGVKLTGSGDVIVTQGDTEGLVVEAEDNILPLIETTVKGDGILHLGMKDHVGSVQTHKSVVYRLAVKTLDKAVVEGSGSVRAASLTADGLRIELPGSGEVSVDKLKAGTVTAEIDGSGNVKLAGEAHSQTVQIDGSGDYKAKDFKTDATAVEINGSGDARVWANETLKVDINGSGEVGYAGHPKLTKSVNGSGGVHGEGAKED